MPEYGQYRTDDLAEPDAAQLHPLAFYFLMDYRKWQEPPLSRRAGDFDSHDSRELRFEAFVVLLSGRLPGNRQQRMKCGKRRIEV